MNEKSLIPSLRFVGFTDAWERRKLGELGKARSGIGFPDAEQGGTDGLPFFKVSDMNISGNEHEMTKSQNYVSIEQIQRKKWTPILEVPAMFFAKVGAAVLLNRKRLCRTPFLLDNNTMAYSVCGEKWNVDFAKALFDTVYLPSLIQVGALPSYNARDVESLEITLPNMEEQSQIGHFFRSLDCLITLHQRKHEKLLNIKKSMLEKMFPKNGELFPEVRFAGFTAAWERRRLGETFTFLQNNTLSRADLSDSGDGAKNIHYGDILVKFGECTNIAKESLPIIMNGSVINKYRSSFLKNGDIVIADTAEDETVGKCTEIIEEKGEKIISGLHTIPCRPTCAFAGGFLGYYMNSPAFHDQFIPLMQGIKVTSISKGALQTTIVQYPHEKTEQAQIGRMFQQLDHLITLHQRKLERLQNIKKACLEKMFV